VKVDKCSSMEKLLTVETALLSVWVCESENVVTLKTSKQEFEKYRSCFENHSPAPALEDGSVM